MKALLLFVAIVGGIAHAAYSSAEKAFSAAADLRSAQIQSLEDASIQ